MVEEAQCITWSVPLERRVRRGRLKMEKTNWKAYFPTILIETDNFIATECPSTTEGIDTLRQMERMRELGYRFVVEGWKKLIWEKVPNAGGKRP